MVFQRILVLVTVLLGIHSQNKLKDLKRGWQELKPCELMNKIKYRSEAVNPEDGEFNIFLSIDEYLEINTIINITLGVPLAVYKASSSKQFYFSRQDKLNIQLLSSEKKLLLRLKTLNGEIPIIESLRINDNERCRNYSITTVNNIPLKELSDRFSSDTNSLPEPVSSRKQENQICGIRKVQHTQLISNGFDANPGDWPWHAALHVLDQNSASFNYSCGGTLISNNIVLTAAHCASEKGKKLLSEILRVILGKYSLSGAGDRTQDKKVSKIIIHPKYNHKTLVNNIALLRLDPPAQYNEFVQPACLWKPELSIHFPLYSEIPGTVVGWGYTLKSELSQKLQQANIPRVSITKCVKSNPTFFGKALNGKNFCIGWRNGTSPCNGDSGGGFHVNTPESTFSGAPKKWHVQGIISQGAALGNTTNCDPNQYVIVTNLEKYIEWINKNL